MTINDLTQNKGSRRGTTQSHVEDRYFNLIINFTMYQMLFNSLKRNSI